MIEGHNIFNRLRIEPPLQGEQIVQEASWMRDLLVKHPGMIRPFMSSAREYIAEYSYAENANALQGVNKLLTNVGRLLTEHDWAKEAERDIHNDEIRELLQAIPGPKEQYSSLNEVANQLAKGFISTRFEKTVVEDPYEAFKHEQDPARHRKINHRGWRGTVRFLRQILESVVSQEKPDMGLAKKWLDLMHGKYERIMPQESFPWRSLFVAARTPNPEDEDTLFISGELGQTIAQLAETFGEILTYQANGRRYTNVMTKFYQNELVHRLNKKPIGKNKIPLEVREAVQLQLKYQRRAHILNTFINRDFMYSQADTEMLQTYISGEDEKTFPGYVLMKRSFLKEATERLVPFRVRINRIIKNLEEVRRGVKKNWYEIPFARTNISGYLFVPLDHEPKDAQEKAKIVDKYLKEYEDTLKPPNEDGFDEAARIQGSEDVIWVLTKATYSEFTPLKSYLDEKLELLRKRASEILSKNIERARAIPQHVTDFPSVVGHKYSLQKNPGLTDVFKSFFLRSTKKEEGTDLVFSLIPLKEKRYFSDDPQPIRGKIIFDKGNMKVVFDEETPKLDEDELWILESVIGQLINASLCQAVGGDDISSSEPSEGHEKSTPLYRDGKIVHIGVRKKTGEPGRHTAYAAGNYRTENARLVEETGLTLDEIDSAHERGEVPCVYRGKSRGCEGKLHVTYRRKQDPPSELLESIPAVEKQAPVLVF